jgi:hypothetical protein
MSVNVDAVIKPSINGKETNRSHAYSPTEPKFPR